MAFINCYQSMKGKYKRKQIWCSGCDANIVQIGAKCEVCGNREHAPKQKKPKIKPQDID